MLVYERTLLQSRAKQTTILRIYLLSDSNAASPRSQPQKYLPIKPCTIRALTILITFPCPSPPPTSKNLRSSTTTPIATLTMAPPPTETPVSHRQVVETHSNDLLESQSNVKAYRWKGTHRLAACKNAWFFAEGFKQIGKEECGGAFPPRMVKDRGGVPYGYSLPGRETGGGLVRGLGV